MNCEYRSPYFFRVFLDSVSIMKYIWFYQVRDKGLPGRSFRREHQADRPQVLKAATRAEDCRVEIKWANACDGISRCIQPDRSNQLVGH
jgi:hypothetical protein